MRYLCLFFLILFKLQLRNLLVHKLLLSIKERRCNLYLIPIFMVSLMGIKLHAVELKTLLHQPRVKTTLTEISFKEKKNYRINFRGDREL